MSLQETITNTLVKRIKNDKIMSQAELARVLGISEAAVSRWLNGTGLIKLEYVIPICDALKITPNELFNYDINLENRELLDILDKNPKLKAYVLSMKDE